MNVLVLCLYDVLRAFILRISSSCSSQSSGVFTAYKTVTVYTVHIWLILKLVLVCS